MNFRKRIISAVLSAVLLAGIFSALSSSVSAKDNSSVIFDFNGDKVSDGKDYEDAVNLNKSYHAPILQEIIYGGLACTDYDTSEADGIPRYFLTNINQCTTPRCQKPLNDCWAQASIGMLESAALKAKSLLKNPNVKIDSKAFGEPVLNGLENKVLYSPRAVAWFFGEGLKAEENALQTGEGCVFSDKDITRFDVGGLLAYSETLFTAWRGVFTEAKVPHQPNGWNGTIDNLNENKSWELSDKMSGKSFDKAPRVTDFLLLPPTSNYSNNNLTGTRNWESSNKKSVSIIKQSILDHGAVHMTYDTTADSLSETFYCSKENSLNNHAALIVGWDDNFSKDNYVGNGKTTPPEDGAWLVKNSFGSYDYMKSLYKNWDVDREGIMGMTYAETQAYYKKKNTSLEKMKKRDPYIENKYQYEFGIRDSKDRGTGFFWVYYCDRSIGGYAAYNVDIADDGYDYDNNYQYDYAQCLDDSRLSMRKADTGTLVGNVFTAKGKEKLKAFSTYTNATDSVVKTDIYLLNGSESNPSQGALAYTSEDKIKFAGFHTIKLNDEINLEKGQKFAVVQNIKSYDKGTDADVSYLNLETVFDSDKISVGAAAKNKVVCNDGETYVRLDGNWTTPKELNENLDIAQLVEFGNAKIKAFTINENRKQTTDPDQKKSASVNKKANPIKVMVKNKTIQAKKLKKKAQKVKSVTIKSAQGKVNIKITSAKKAIKKYLKFNSKGTLTIKRWKQSQKGTYKIKVKITVKGNSKYKPKTIKKTVKIKIN